jgi:protease-4
MGATSRFARRAVANLARGTRELCVRGALPRADAPAWLALRLGPPLEDLAPPHVPFARLPGLGLLHALAALDAAARDPGVVGVALRIAGPLGGFSRALSLRRALDQLRDAGRPVVVWADALDAASFVAVSGASRLCMPPTGSLFLVGVRLEGLYLRGLFERLGLRPEVVRVGTHKTAGDRFVRESMSAEEREQLEALADDLFAELVGAVARGRGLAEERVRALVDAGPYLGESAVAAGLADACVYPDELDRELLALAPQARAKGPGPERARRVDASLYCAARAADPGWRPAFRELPRVAVVAGRGMIHRGSGHRGIACERMGGLLEALRRDERVRAVVLRLESPGGDALASDLLWRSVSQLAREKPVVVSMGDVVASGAYYAAAAAHAIVAEAGTLTGSIGVVGGKLDAEGLARRLGVARQAVERGARAGLLSETRGFTAPERAAVQSAMHSIYATFVARVAEGRRLPAEQVERAAQGRIWSGTRARAQGLVDSLGGPLEALAEARLRAQLGPGERVAVEYHPRAPALPGLRSLLSALPGRFERS